MDSQRFVWVLFLMVIWYITSIAAGVYNKDFLMRHDLPMLLTLCQSFAGVLGGLVALGSLKRIQYFSTWQEFRILILLGLVHCIGTVLTNISTAKSTASFTHTIKASEPLFAVLISFLVIGTRPSRMELTSLITTTVGIALACTTEFDFQLAGFLTAFLSNLVFSTRSIFSKKLFAESPLDNQNVFLYISIITCNMLVPAMIYETATSGFAEIATALSLSGDSFWILLEASVSHYLYNMLSFLLLNEISPVSHSVWGSFKRLFIIYFSVWYFGNVYTLWNTIASMVAVVGVTIYSFSGSKPTKKAKVDPPKSPAAPRAAESV